MSANTQIVYTVSNLTAITLSVGGLTLNPKGSAGDTTTTNLLLSSVISAYINNTVSISPPPSPSLYSTYNLNEQVAVIPTSYNIVQSIINVGVTSTQLVPANPNRKYLAFMVVGTADVTISAGTSAAVFGQGIICQSGGANLQGSGQEFSNGVPTNAFQCIALTTGSNIIVWEGM